jgi:hypothetical protein
MHAFTGRAEKNPHTPIGFFSSSNLKFSTNRRRRKEIT